MSPIGIFPLLLVSMVLVATADTPQVPCASDATALIPDLRLQAAIRSQLGLTADQAITEATLAGLRRLGAAGDPSAGAVVCSLRGLEGATALTTLDLSDNRTSEAGLTDLAPLSRLTSLKSLNLRANGISDLSPLRGLRQLEFLDLSGNLVEQASPLAGLSHLRTLDLKGNVVGSIGALSGLTQLRNLNLSDNDLVDVGGLERLLQLRNLDLAGNRISTLKPLSDNLGLGDGDVVEAERNCLDLSDGSTESRYAEALRNRGVTLTVEPQRSDCESD